VDREAINREAEQPAAGAGEYYLLVCLIALVVTVLALSELRLGARLYAPYMVFGLGVTSLVFRLPSAPPLMLLTTTVLMLSQPSRALALARSGPGSGMLVYQLLFCGGMLAFITAYYRRLAVEAGIFPSDQRKGAPVARGRRLAKLDRVCRSAALVPVNELLTLAIAVPVFCGIGYLLLNALDRATPPRGVGVDNVAFGEWRLLILLWIVVGAGVPIAVVWGYLDRALATPTQNLLYLQDQLWDETVSEQSGANRKLARRRLGKLTGKEKP
jgi:hypothetical protein